METSTGIVAAKAVNNTSTMTLGAPAVAEIAKGYVKAQKLRPMNFLLPFFALTMPNAVHRPLQQLPGSFTRINRASERQAPLPVDLLLRELNRTKRFLDSLD